MTRNLSAWLAWQETLHLSSIDLGLTRVRQVAKNLDLLNLPFPVISVAGTNGKGSSTAMLQSIYQQAGYKTGVYTSPHLLRYNERIAINNEYATDDAVCSAFEKINTARKETSLTYFEFATLAAVVLFVEEAIDIAIFEVGLGGRLDAVNLWDADIALITSIAIDHESWLGNNREDIAIEKAGIMRQGNPVICGDKNPPTTIASEAQRIGAQLVQRNKDFSLTLPKASDKQWFWHNEQQNQTLALPLPNLKGVFQLDNAANVVAVIQYLQHKVSVSLDAIQQGLQTTTLIGRLQLISSCPELLLDVAHNPHAAEQLALYLKTHPVQGKTVALFSVLVDKDLEGIVGPFTSLIDEWHIVNIEGERGQSAEDIKSKLEKISSKYTITLHNNFKKPTQELKNTLNCEDRVVAFGSFLVVSKVLESVAKDSGLNNVRNLI
ncbi:MAG: bifunctional tetrahydrofolate synthase/dihydrofolate synthase [Aquificaceae bacterium]|nr:MAG: bifunctional tetrahydrofolate synthase/dihydrofolate synthase [Aquificaceae bacterium]